MHNSHAPQPGICSECFDIIIGDIENGNPVATAYWCEHTSTLATIKVEARRIVSWRLMAPRTEAEALRFGAELVAIQIARIGELMEESKKETQQ
jgi:hypothetical protein